MKPIVATKRTIAVLAVITALCADHAVQAAPSARTQGEIAQLASRLVTRLARNFHRTLPAAISRPARQQQPADAPSRPIILADNSLLAHAPIAPFQFRLPPPIA